MKVINSEVSCPMCGAGRPNVFLTGPDRMHTISGTFVIRICRQCGLRFIHPSPDNGTLARHYPENYYAYEAGETAVPARARGKPAHYLRHPVQGMNAAIYSRLLGVNKDVAVPPGSAVLDVGCGDGGYLLKKKAEGCRCWGVDISEAALARLRRRDPSIATHCGDIRSASFDADFFDLITFSHVLEHVRDPIAVLAEACRILKPEGYVRIQIPNPTSLTAWLFGRFWVHHDVPRHLYSFTSANLQEIASRCGLCIAASRTIENAFSVLASLVYVSEAASGQRGGLMTKRRFWDSEWLKLALAPYCIVVNMLKIGDTVEYILNKPAAGHSNRRPMEGNLN